MLSLQGLQDLLSAPSVDVHIGTLVANLVIAAGLAWVLGEVYARYGTSLSNRRSFAKNFLLLATTTTVVITVVKSSLALSLGLVGALSIVRFRSAIKEPEELAYLFLTIAIGLGLGADQRLVTLAAFAVICGMIYLRHLHGPRAEEANLFLTVASREPAAASQLDAIVEVLRAHCASVSLHRIDERPDALEASFRVRFADFDRLQAGRRALRELDDGLEITLLDPPGAT